MFSKYSRTKGENAAETADGHASGAAFLDHHPEWFVVLVQQGQTTHLLSRDGTPEHQETVKRLLERGWAPDLGCIFSINSHISTLLPRSTKLPLNFSPVNLVLDNSIVLHAPFGCTEVDGRGKDYVPQDAHQENSIRLARLAPDTPDATRMPYLVCTDT